MFCPTKIETWSEIICPFKKEKLFVALMYLLAQELFVLCCMFRYHYLCYAKVNVVLLNYR